MKRGLIISEQDKKHINGLYGLISENLNESITLNGVTISPANSKSGGPVKTQYNNITNLYSVVVDTATYDGKVGVKYIYKKGSKYYMETNVKQTFPLKIDKLKYITTQIKKGAKTIKVSQGSWPLDADITFTKK